MTFDYDPKFAPTSKPPFCQTIRLKDVGHLTWHTTAPGVVQIIDIQIKPDLRRKGFGSALLSAAVAETKRLGCLKKMWAATGHESGLIARAFLTKQGFHHISSTSDLLKKEDLLIFVKSWV